ncbi:RulB protein [Pseudomonas syringae]|nr:RulB protein [Pseudomonas syringae]
MFRGEARLNLCFDQHATLNSSIQYSEKFLKIVRGFRGYPINDVRLLTKGATEAVNRLFRPGYKYSKAEVLLDLRQPGEFTDDLFAESQPAAAQKVMGVLDEINARWGRGTLRAGSVPSDPVWAMRRDMMSQSYTTRLDQLWVVRAD